MKFILIIYLFLLTSNCCYSQQNNTKIKLFTKIGQKELVRAGDNISIVLGPNIKPEYSYLSYSPGMNPNEYFIELKSNEPFLKEISRLKNIIDSSRNSGKFSTDTIKTNSPKTHEKPKEISSAFSHDSIIRKNLLVSQKDKKFIQGDYSIFSMDKYSRDIDTIQNYLRLSNNQISNNKKIIEKNKNRIDDIKLELERINFSGGNFSKISQFISQIDSLVSFNNILMNQNIDLTENKAILEKELQIKNLEYDSLKKLITYLLVVSALIILVTFFIYLNYRQKKKFSKELAKINEKLENANNELSNSNIQLTEQNIRIQEQYELLSKLNNEKDRLLSIINRELENASLYVRSLIPKPIREFSEDKITTDWLFVPTTELGGDSFGYRWLTKQHFAFFILDVSGHGIGSALHSVQVLNILQNKTLPNVDFTKPDEVLKALNKIFQMKDHHEIYFTMIYAVYSKETNILSYASAGHPPLVLFNNDNSYLQLSTENVFIGAFPKFDFVFKEIEITKPCSIYLYSDGVYELSNPEEQLLDFGEFIGQLEIINRTGKKLDELYINALDYTKMDSLSDDYSILKIGFHK